MYMSICTDAHGRVTGVCPDNLAGGEGWAWIETNLTPATEICDTRGVALYKVVDGKVSPRSAAEIAADAPEPISPEPTVEDRLAAVEAATLDMMLLGGVL